MADMRDVLDPEIILARMDGNKSESTYQKDQIVYSQGSYADCVLYIRAGNAKMTVVSEDGKEAIAAILRPGDFCGEKCLTGRELRMATVTAVTECKVLRMRKADIARALHNDPDVFRLFMTYLIERNIRAQDNLASQLLNSTEKRLARLLLNLANYGKSERAKPIVPKIDQQTLAETIGATRTRVNFFMNKFRQLGLIEYNGDIKVNDSLLNTVLQKKV
jgi:CRP/FNR family transcriptional regulator, cyclic AMP receptor protein